MVALKQWRISAFKTHIVRLGGFHTLSCFIASIGKLWGDCGLKDILVDSSVYAAGTVDQMMCGKQFKKFFLGLFFLLIASNRNHHAIDKSERQRVP
jgi:hypothetical protein